jgi:metalloendopeptidase OMA1, mitochondrial
MQFPFPRRSQDYNGGPRRGRVLWLPLLAVGLFVALQYFSAETFINPETGEKKRVALSVDQESALGLQSFKEVLSQSQRIDSGAEIDMVRTVARRLIEQVDPESKKFEWMVSLVDSDQVNAFCLPGGKIVVFTGILPVAKSPDGLAAVMGHEIAHATSRHGAQRMLQQGLLQTAMIGANVSLSEMDPQKRQLLLGALGAGVQYGLILPYGRDHELEADEIGLRYMARAGYDPEEAIRFWERMEQAAESRAPPEWMSTHPSHGSRIQQLKELLPSIMAGK